MKKYETLEDIIFFGSFVKGKPKPGDLDIALLIHRKDERALMEKEISDILHEYKVSFTLFTVKEIYSQVWFSVITSGYSVSHGEFIQAIYGIEPCKLYKYSLSSLSPVKKVQFSRGLDNISEEAGIIRLSRAILIVPLKNSERFEDFLKNWGIDFEARRYELLPEYRKQAGF